MDHYEDFVKDSPDMIQGGHQVTLCPVVNSHTDEGCSGVETEIEVVKVPTSMVFH